MDEGSMTVDKAKVAARSRRRTAKVSEIIAREIVHDSRGLPPGTMLPSEAKLLERYQVGRTSLREALRVLEMQGLIVIRPGPGGGPMLTEVDS
jgi:DNA-binding FadR family transcriptional regulator